MKEGERMEHTFEKRKKVIYDLICDDLYVPMKLKEIAMLLQIPREQRNELKEVLEALEADGKIYVSKSIAPLFFLRSRSSPETSAICSNIGTSFSYFCLSCSSCASRIFATLV